MFITLSFQCIYAQSTTSDLKKRILDKSYAFEAKDPVVPFIKISGIRSDAIERVVSDPLHLELNLESLRKIYHDGDNFLKLSIPYKKESFSLWLMRQDVLGDGFSLRTPDSDQAIAYKKGYFYRGIVHGDSTSIAVASIFEGQIMMYLQTREDGDIIIGRSGTDYILYRTKDLKVEQTFACLTEDPDFDARELIRFREFASRGTALVRSQNTIKVYFECEHDLVQEKGGAAGAADYISGIFNIVSVLYEKENIPVEISEIFAWTSPDPYSTESPVDALVDFRKKRSTYNGDVAHLVSRGPPNGGGVAWVGTLCTDFAYTYCYLTRNYTTLPNYSWSVNVIAHEMGHVLGSIHTHNCQWPGGPIDNCYTPEGICDPGPSPENGGTIMSYCHLTSTGINFENGFGELPGNLIRSEIAKAKCILPSGVEPTCDDGIRNGDETGVDCGGACDPCPTCDDGIQNGVETGVDCGGTCPDICPGEYCRSRAGSTQYEHIRQVTIGSFSHSSGGSNGFQDHTDSIILFEPNTSYEVTLTPGYGSTVYDEYWTIYLDLNHDLEFQDNELLFEASGKNQVTGSLTIPVDANKGQTRLRIQMKWNSAADGPCDEFKYGEVEGYTAHIQGNEPQSCSDGVQNGAETGIDCGGNCPPCATCYDEIQNGDETGIDCGGSCPDQCPVLDEYCGSSSSSNKYEHISTVIFNEINNSSGADGGYGDYTHISTEVNAGLTYPITLKTGYTSAAYSESWQVWIDFNRDGDFSDEGELIVNSSARHSISTEVSIPTLINPGPSRMRIHMKWNSPSNDPCTTFKYGEVEDYSVELLPSEGASDIPSLARDIRVFPNPAGDYTVLASDRPFEGTEQIFVYNAMGELLLRADVSPGANEAVIELSQLPPGTYWIQLGEVTASKTLKLVKSY